MGNLALVLTATFSAVHGGMTASGTNSIGGIRRPSVKLSRRQIHHELRAPVSFRYGSASSNKFDISS